MILTALTVFACANLAAAIAPGFSALIALRAVAGLAAAVVSSSACAVAAQGAPSNRQGHYLSVITAGLTVALFTGVPVGAWVGALWGWRSTFVLIAAVALAAVLVLLLVGIVGVPSALLGGHLADTYGGRRSRLIVIGGHALALALVGGFVALSAPFPRLLLGIAAWPVFAWALNPPLQASVIEAAPDAPTTAISLNISGLYLGTAAAAGLGGMIVDGQEHSGSHSPQPPR